MSLQTRFRLGEASKEDLEKALIAHKGNAAVGIVNENKRHLSFISSYQRYENNGDGVVFYHEIKSQDTLNLTASKGDLCFIGSADSIDKIFSNYRKKFFS